MKPSVTDEDFVERFWSDNVEKIGEHGLYVHGCLKDL